MADKYQEITLAEQWTEVIVAEPEEDKETLAEEVARLAEERKLVATETVSDTWSEIANGIPGGDILGELSAKSPAFQKYLEQKLANQKPVVQKVPLQKARDYSISFGPVYGQAGTTTTLMVQPEYLFRGEKILAYDTARTPGLGAGITQLLVGRRLQMPNAGGPRMAAMFSNNNLGRGLKMDTCQRGFGISVTISFVESCTFAMTIFGRAVE